MQKTTPWIVRLLQMASVLFVLLGCLLVFIYTPFYSNFMISVLNRVVEIEVNPVAAQSQKNARLTEQETLEPGSELWIARQAYLKMMEQSLKNDDDTVPDLKLLQARYQLLQQQIETELEQAQDRVEPIIIPLLAGEEASSTATESMQEIADLRELLTLSSDKNKQLMDHYLDFLAHHPLEEMAASELTLAVDDNVDALPVLETQGLKNNAKDAYAIVVLGGGLTLAENGQDIVVNDYTRLRLEKTLAIEKEYQLPIVLSGVEAPYMQRWLKEHEVDAKLLEDRSMNTCENSRFSSLLLQKKGGAPRVILITDRYHMPRTRRLFALNGIETVPVEAPMPTRLTHWRPSEQNYDHSRRANYEILATIRDVWFGSSDCREVP